MTDIERAIKDKRAILLNVYRRSLNIADLEEVFNQAALEAWQRSLRDPFANYDHARRSLEQKFQSRICDARRAKAGRSPDLIHRADRQLLDHENSLATDTLEQLCEQRDRILRGLHAGVDQRGKRQSEVFSKLVFAGPAKSDSERKSMRRTRERLAGI